MLRAVTSRFYAATSAALRANIQRTCAVQAVRYSSHVKESDEEFDARYEAAFNDPNTDGWLIRKLMNDLHGYDLVPEPKIIIAAMKACRRVNDYAMAVRYLEAIKLKCDKNLDKIWPWMLQEIGPTLKELGIDTPEELGYDKPELAKVNVFDIH
ncbi:hypothetical protein LSH36_368g01062 [Paralvinella palmiformis]|uniref:Cytochrome c oxidase subunit 5A, mitochondrial n=1 Tax=Paralvinella palmiformis TaxID=53620 RepID=A0AAD9JER2_9ANNE|nr:hypothetical protein LSH36_368g01062 [Paralvinella palmiformis]